MKKIMLLTTSLLLFVIVHAQHVRTNQIKSGNGDTTWNNLTGPFKRTNTTNGNVLMKQESGKYKLFATFKRGKVTNWHATDTKGNKIPVTYTAKAGNYCQVCVILADGHANCYQISCDDMPAPKPDKKAARTAH